MTASLAETPTSIQVRPMLAADVEQVLDIDHHSFNVPWPKTAYHYELHKNPNSLLWVAETTTPSGKKQVVGMIVIWMILDEAHIATLAVHPDYRRCGIAKRLLNKSLREAVEKGAVEATLEVRTSNLAAQELYRRYNFEVVGHRHRYYRDNHEDALIMSLTNLDRSIFSPHGIDNQLDAVRMVSFGEKFVYQRTNHKKITGGIL